MQFRDYQKLLVEFVEQEMMQNMVITKRRYLKNERKLIRMCTLDEKVDNTNDLSRIELLVGIDDVKMEDFLPLEQQVENKNISDALKLLSSKEKRVVSLLFNDINSFKEICSIIGTSRLKTPYEIYYRALNKMRKNIKKGNEGKKNER